MLGYDVVSLIGRGAASTLYAVTDTKGQLFALKHVVKKAPEEDDRYIDQLRNEFEVSQKFRHPGLRKTIEFKIPRRLFSSKISEAALVLEWVDGVGLDEKVPSDLTTLLKVFAHGAAALISLHHLRLVHCDFKPHNVLVLDDGKIKLIDFGQTCPINAVKHRIQGTADYIAPEQVKRAPVDPKTDTYSFGASLYWALTARKVPTYMTVDKTHRDQIKQQLFPTPRDLRPELSEPLSKLAMRCLMYNPDHRPDMVQVLTALDEIIQPPPAAAPAAPEHHAPHKPQPRRVQDWGL